MEKRYSDICSIAAILLFMALFVRSAYIYAIVIIVLLAMSIKRLNPIFIIFVASVLMAILAFNKELVGDLRMYSLYYDFASSNTLTEVLGSSRSDFSIRRSEIIYRIYNWAASSAGVEYRFFHAFTIWMSYFFMLIFGIKYSNQLSFTAVNSGAGTKNLDRTYAILWVLLVSVSFTLTSQVMRQYLSISLFALGLALYLEPNRNKIFLLPLLMAALVHNATVLLLLVFLVNRFMWEPLSKTSAKILMLALAFALGYVLPSLLGPLVALLNYNLEEVNLGPTVILDSALVIGLLVSSHAQRDKNVNTKFVISLAFLIVSMIVFFREVPILLLRLYFYMDIVRLIAGISIYRSLTDYSRVIFAIICILLAPVYLSLIHI